MGKRIASLLVIVGVFSFWTIIPTAQATTIEQITSLEALQNSDMQNNFVVGPGKTEMTIQPGETSVKNVTVTNRFLKQMKFKLEVEDFTSPDSPGELIKLLGSEKGPYSLKDYIYLDTYEIILQPGDRANIPVKITIPTDAQPGALYGAVISSYETTDPLELKRLQEAEIAGGVKMISRIATLFFIRVPPAVEQKGALNEFKSEKKWYRSGPIDLSWLYQNDGNVYNTPYGVIEITNLYGMVVDQFSIDPYYVMPHSVRTMERNWEHAPLLGRYKATLQLNLGFGDKIETRTVVFWVLPWKYIAGILVGLFLILVIIRGIRRWFKKSFEYKGKKKTETPPPSSPQA